ncbi:MAG: hypothetical protein QOD30_569, partial [Actinomycetota bacterium]|nr:hypothetical protein [Actinomycetota bacterium]
MGSGKSRLVEELLSRATDLRPLIVRCEPYERTTPFHPVKRLLAQLVPTEAGALASLVSERAPALAPWLPLAAAVLDVAVDETDETRLLDPRFRLERTASVTAELLRALLDEPTVLVIEDVHWLDDASATVLRQVEAKIAEVPWLVCATCRNEPSTFVPAESSSLVQLAPLGDLDMAALVAVATADAPLPPHVRDALVQRAAGNPLFLTELLDHGVESVALPESVEAVMAAQIDRLPPDERRLLRHAAVLGSRFDTALLAEISGEPDVAGSSARLLARRLGWMVVPEGDGRLRFRHQLVRDVAYESLPFRVRRDLHGRAGDAILRSATDEQAGVLSLHFLRANRHEDCWTYARRAAARACDKHANVEAVELLERALSTIRHLEHIDEPEVVATWKDLATRHTFLGNGERAKDALRQARRWARDDAVEVASLCRYEARVREREGDTVALLRWIRQGLRAVEGNRGRDAGAIRAELLVLHAWVKHQQGRALAARRLALAGLAEGEASGNDQAVAGALLALDGIDATLGAPSDPARAERAIAIYESLGHLEDVGMVLINLGSNAYQRSEWAAALSMNGRGRELLKRTGNLAEAAYGSFNMAEVLIDQGHLEEASAILDELRDLWRAVDHALGLAYLEGLAGRLAARRGDHAAAVASLLKAEASLAQTGMDTLAIEMAGRCAESMVAVGDVDAATTKVEAAIVSAERLGDALTMPLLLRARALCRAALGDIAGAAADLADGLTMARERSAKHDVVLALHLAIAIAIDPTRAASLDVERDELAAELGIVELPAIRLEARGSTTLLV